MKTEKIFYERLDKVFDALNDKNIKIDNDLFNRYTKFSRNYLDKLEELVNVINNNKHLWVQIDDEIIKFKINKLFYDSTFQYHEYTDDYIDVYKIEYENGLSETISSIELLAIIQKGAVKRKKGIIGLNREIVNDLLYETIF